ncbi:MAG: hypothetical protein R3A48_27140 [Polyangiales bacterium]
MNKLASALFSLALSAAPAAASAQTTVYEVWLPPPPLVLAPQPIAPQALTPQPAPAPAPAAEGVRVRFGVASNLTVGLANDRGHGVNTGVFAPGLTLDLGAQLRRGVAVYLRASVATLLVLNQASLYGVIEYSPTDVLSLGTGVGWDGMGSVFTGNDVACCAGPIARNTWSAVSVPAIVGFNLGRRDPSTGRLRGMRIGLEGALGMEPGSGALGWHAALSFGYVTM